MPHRNILFPSAIPFNYSRRRFVQGLTAGSLLWGLGAPLSSALGRPLPTLGPGILRGNRFALDINYQEVNFTGTPRIATAINSTVPAPTLRWREGDVVRIQVTNRLAQDSSIHWHGLILPSHMDGVPEISFAGIRPGETFEYRFKVQQSGTYWYHSHSGFQEQTGMYGAIIIDPATPEPFSYDREYVVMLSDWSDDDPADIYANLKKLSHYYNVNQRTVGDLWRDLHTKGAKQTLEDRAMWNRMRMSDRDLSDVTGHTYTYLMNGIPPATGWIGRIRQGETIRLRIINGSAMTFFDVRIPGLAMKVVAADGQNIEPVSVEEFRIGVAETYDVIVTPDSDRPYTLFAQAIDRTGYARGTLSPDPSLIAAVPEMDPLPILSHIDMGMAMSAHQVGDTSADGRPDHAGSQQMMDHSQHGMRPHDNAAQAPSASAGVTHKASEFGPHVDMHAANPHYRLDDPGVGLRHNGRRVLTYADLVNLTPTKDPREPTREIELHLTGNMSRYMWSIDGIKFADAAPLPFRFGERLRITLVNDTMMHHPMHLHGMWSELETGAAGYLPRKHTVVLQPGAKISYQVTADAIGNWAYHCHLLYHMPGMFREVSVKNREVS